MWGRTLVVALSMIGCVPDGEPVGSASEALRDGEDRFGVRMIYPSASSGPSFFADFSRSFSMGPGDTSGMLWNRGNGTLTSGGGTAIARGSTQRLYIGDRSESVDWRSLELTYYARRRDDLTRDELLAGPSGAGITAEVRTGDGHSSSASDARLCEAHAYGGTFRFYGHAAFAKELKHPQYAPSGAATGGSVRENVWPSGVPRGQWIGFKLIVLDVDGGVRLELWRDLTNGRDGGAWERLLAYTDRPGRWGIPDTPTLCGLPTDRILPGGPYVIVRNESTEVEYKWLSIRTIEGAPASGTSYVDIGDSLFLNPIRNLEDDGHDVPCNPPWDTWYCPNDPVRRDEAAAFFVRALGLSPPGGNRFVDDDGNPFEDDIEALAECGISRGCNPPTNDRFCPTNVMNRGQMAAFFDRAYELPATGTDYFTDDDGSIFEASINRLAASGITRGCNPPANDRFCPTDEVTRGQMAAFIERAKASVTPNPACVCTPATERCNDLDDDCDGSIDENASAEMCGGGDQDCDGAIDENARPETCDGTDEDCDGAVDEDADAESCNELDDDCDGAVDEHASPELPGDGVDQDCDGAIDEAAGGDGGTGGSDGGVASDGGRADGGTESASASGGCGCAVGASPSGAWPLLLALGWLWRRRRV